MSDNRDILRRAVGNVAPHPDAYEHVLRRRERRYRNQRLAAGALALALAIGFVALFVVLSPTRSERVPSERVPVDEGASNGRITFSDGDGIQVIQPDGSGQVQLISGAEPDYPAWSPDGAKIAFVRGGSLFVANADGSGETLVQGPINDNHGFLAPSWSPDGNQLVFAAGFGGRYGTYRLYVVNVDGSGLTKITEGHQDWWPSWSPDGTKIAFATGTAGSGRDLATISPDGSNRTTLVRGSVNYPDWSPDGSQILFVDSTDGWDVFAIGSDGTARTRLTDSPDEAEFFPVYSPDGTQIAFRCPDQGPGTYICTMAIGGTEDPVEVVKVDFTEHPVAWQPT